MVAYVFTFLLTFGYLNSFICFPVSLQERFPERYDPKYCHMPRFISLVFSIVPHWVKRGFSEKPSFSVEKPGFSGKLSFSAKMSLFRRSRVFLRSLPMNRILLYQLCFHPTFPENSRLHRPDRTYRKTKIFSREVGFFRHT